MPGLANSFRITNMLDTLIRSKTRLNLLLRFFLNPGNSAYLRELSKEFGTSTNSVRIELNRFEKAGLIRSQKEGNKKMYSANTASPLYPEIQKLTFNYFGIDQIVDRVIIKLGNVEAVYLTGELAKGLEHPVADITLVGKDIDREYLVRLTEKAQKQLGKHIRTLVYESDEEYELELPNVLIYGR